MVLVKDNGTHQWMVSVPIGSRHADL